MQQKEFILKDLNMSGYLMNHYMTCGISENSTTLCLNMDDSSGKMMNADDKITLYFPNGSDSGDLTDDKGKSINARLYGDDWTLTHVGYHPIYKTKAWTLKPKATFYMEAGKSISVVFETITVNSNPGLSGLRLVTKDGANVLETDIQKYRKPETVSMWITPESFVFGDEISVCFTVTDPGQYKSIKYCGKELDLSKSSFEEKEKAKCDAGYKVSITNMADYVVDSICSVSLQGLKSYSIKNISPTGVELNMDLIEANVDQCRLHDEISGKDCGLAAKSGEQTVKLEVKENRRFYPIINLRETLRQEEGIPTPFCMPVIKRFGPSDKEVLEDADGFLSVEQVKESKTFYSLECKAPPSPPAYTLYYELEHVEQCWLQIDSRKITVDVKGKSITFYTFLRKGTVHAIGDYGYDLTRDITW